VIVTATASETGAEVAPRHLDLDTPKYAFPRLGSREGGGVEVVHGLVLPITGVEAKPHPHGIRHRLIIQFNVAAEPDLTEGHLGIS